MISQGNLTTKPGVIPRLVAKRVLHRSALQEFPIVSVSIVLIVLEVVIVIVVIAPVAVVAALVAVVAALAAAVVHFVGASCSAEQSWMDWTNDSLLHLFHLQ